LTKRAITRFRYIQCLGDEIGTGVLVIGNFSVVGNSDNEEKHPGLDFRFADPSGRRLYSRSMTRESGFRFQTGEDGEYVMCWENSDRRNAVVELDMEVGANARFKDLAATKLNMQPVEVALVYLEVQLKNLLNKVEDIRMHENEMEITTASTAQRLLRFSFLTILSLLVLGIWEVFYIQRFLRSKYIL
jgi:p24 family protein delta-1